MKQFETILRANEYTVAAQFEPRERPRRASIQSEAELEKEFIEILTSQGYEYALIRSPEALRDNLRQKLQELNRIEFTDSEWNAFFKKELANDQNHIVEKTRMIQDDPVRPFVREDGSLVNVRLLDKDNPSENSVQVVNQYATSGGSSANRYDVTILVNGLPMVHIELKRRGVALREAFNQIERYQEESFWADDGLFEFVQIFVISNGTETKYYSNTVRSASIAERGSGGKGKKTRATWEFTSYWADAANNLITDLADFAETFFAKRNLLTVLAKYCVFTVDNQLLVMRPYQIAATERILNRILIGVSDPNNQTYWTGTGGGGYVWHTTGSGKTLTSFKTARLAAAMDGIDKVLFVVDRKDLDYQTMKEYDRFEKGAANGSASTAVLARQLADQGKNGERRHYPIMVTTIQKLACYIRAAKRNRAGLSAEKVEVANKRIVIIFDECHRSQFGEMHAEIDRFFKKRMIFGFTGTPIFAKNAINNQTTEQAFGAKIHSYNIVDAIRDRNVLPFRIDYLDTIQNRGSAGDLPSNPVDREAALLSPERVRQVTGYILSHFDQKTMRRSYYERRVSGNVEELARNPQAASVSENRRLSGFNSIFATSSIPAACRYYDEFKMRLEGRFGTDFKIALIFSAPAKGDERTEPEEKGSGFLGEENSDSVQDLDQSAINFLSTAIADYNKVFGTNYNASDDSFQTYYKDVSQRMKNRELDLLIVVNMFLTGFDAPTLNTLWVDRNLRMHGLLQAFSRTNRILNSVKRFGNIICFRPLAKAVDESLSLFGNKDASGIVILKTYQDYYFGYTDEKGKEHPGYRDLALELQEKFKPGERPVGEKRENEFIALFGKILRVRNLLSCFDEFEAEKSSASAIITELEMQDYQSVYLDLHDERRQTGEREVVNEDLVFEIELVRQVEVGIDYILELVEKYREKNKNDRELRIRIDTAIASSPELRPKRELVEKFVEEVSLGADAREQWGPFVRAEHDADRERLVEEENLNPELTSEFLRKSLANGEVEESGLELDRILPDDAPLFPFVASEGTAPAVSRVEKRGAVIEKIRKFFSKYVGLIGGKGDDEEN